MFFTLSLTEFWWLLPPVIVGDILLVYFVWLAPRRLGYRVSKNRLQINTFAGARELRHSEIECVKLVEFHLGIKMTGNEIPGYYVGRFRSNQGPVRAFVSRKHGRGVLLELGSGEKLLINPRDPKRCLEPLKIEIEEEP